MMDQSNPPTAIQPVNLQFNDTEITCPLENGHRMIPIKTVCEIIDIDFQTTDSWLKKHEFFGQLYRLTYTVGADGKARKMNCLSIFDLGYWLGGITQANRREGSVEKQTAFMFWLREQTLALYKSVELFVEENKYEMQLLNQKADLLNELEDAQDNVKSIKKRISEINKSVEAVREKRFTGQTALPFPSDN